MTNLTSLTQGLDLVRAGPGHVGAGLPGGSDGVPGSPVATDAAAAANTQAYADVLAASIASAFPTEEPIVRCAHRRAALQ